MMVFLVVVGVVSIIGAVVIAILEARRMDQGKPSLLTRAQDSADEKQAP